MQWFFLICSQTFNLEAIKNLKILADVTSYDVKQIPGRFCVDFGDEHIFFDREVDLTGRHILSERIGKTCRPVSIYV